MYPFSQWGFLSPCVSRPAVSQGMKGYTVSTKETQPLFLWELKSGNKTNQRIWAINANVYQWITKDVSHRDVIWSGSVRKHPEGIMRAELWKKIQERNKGRGEQEMRGLRTVFLKGRTACAEALWWVLLIISSVILTTMPRVSFKWFLPPGGVPAFSALPRSTHSSRVRGRRLILLLPWHAPHHFSSQNSTVVPCWENDIVVGKENYRQLTAMKKW